MTTGNAVIRTTGLSKSYGHQRGIADLDLEVRPGEVFGYLGPNGAGKTTTIRLLLDYIRPTGGSATIFGRDCQGESLALRGRIGYLPGELHLYDSLSGRELVGYFGRLRRQASTANAARLAERLDCDLRREIRTLSTGNRQKLGLVQAFMGKPELLILDEPTSGLDPLVQQTFYALVSEARAAGRTVFLSSHVLPEVERVCDRVGIIREGRLVAVERIADLRSRAMRRLEIEFRGDLPADAFRGVPGVNEPVVTGNVLHCTVLGSMDAVLRTATQFEVQTITSTEPTLEEVFLAYYGGRQADAA